MFEIVDRYSLGSRDQRREHAQTSALVDHSVQPFIGKSPFAGWSFTFHCHPLARQGIEVLPPAIALRHMEYPSPTERVWSRFNGSQTHTELWSRPEVTTSPIFSSYSDEYIPNSEMTFAFSLLIASSIPN